MTSAFPPTEVVVSMHKIFMFAPSRSRVEKSNVTDVTKMQIGFLRKTRTCLVCNYGVCQKAAEEDCTAELKCVDCDPK